jgi:hypothetical protein
LRTFACLQGPAARLATRLVRPCDDDGSGALLGREAGVVAGDGHATLRIITDFAYLSLSISSLAMDVLLGIGGSAEVAAEPLVVLDAALEGAPP